MLIYHVGGFVFVRRVVWALESEAGNKVRGLLNPLLVCPSARPLVRPVRAPSALIGPSARPPVRLYSPCRPPVHPSPVHPSASLLLHVRLSARPPPVHPPTTVCLSALRLPVRPPSAPSASSKNYLSVSFGPQFFTSSTPVRSPRLQFVAPARATVASG